MTADRMRYAAQILGEMGNGRMANELDQFATYYPKMLLAFSRLVREAIACGCSGNQSHAASMNFAISEARSFLPNDSQPREEGKAK